jgi:hypothetical protein
MTAVSTAVVNQRSPVVSSAMKVIVSGRDSIRARTSARNARGSSSAQPLRDADGATFDETDIRSTRAHAAPCRDVRGEWTATTRGHNLAGRRRRAVVAGGIGMADNKSKRGGSDRGLIATSEPYEVRYWAKKLEVTPAKLRYAVKKVGRSAKKVEAYIKLQKHRARDKTLIALSQPYEVEYWSKKFKVTPARLKTAVKAVGRSSKKVGAYLTAAKKTKRKIKRNTASRAA